MSLRKITRLFLTNLIHGSSSNDLKLQHDLKQSPFGNARTFQLTDGEMLLQKLISASPTSRLSFDSLRVRVAP